MRNLILFFLLFSQCFTMLTAQEGGGDKDFLYDFIAGTYEILGKAQDTTYLYSGKITFQKHQSRFKVIREINDTKIIGIGFIEKATGDNVPVLRIYFKENKIEYAATYILGSDLDNYARLSGYLYTVNNETVNPGLETLFFIKPTQNIPD